MRAKIAITADTAPKEAERAASANDDPLNNARPVKYWEIIAENLKKRGWSLVMSQRLILAGERSGLLTRIATTESVSLCERIKS